MTYENLDMLWLAITEIEAQEMLKDLRVADWPNMKKEQRQKLHRDLFKKAYPSNQEARPVGPQDLARMLNG